MPSRVLTNDETLRLKNALRELNEALGAFAEAGYEEVDIRPIDLTDLGTPGRRVQVSINATRAQDRLEL